MHARVLESTVDLWIDLVIIDQISRFVSGLGSRRFVPWQGIDVVFRVRSF